MGLSEEKILTIINDFNDGKINIHEVKNLLYNTNHNGGDWRVFTLSELWDYLNKDKPKSKIFIKPKFPTKRWGKLYTKISTTDKKVIEYGIEELKNDGYTVRKRIDKESTNKFKKQGNFYKIEIKY